MTNEIMSTDQPTPLAQMQKAKAIAKEIAATVGHLIVNIQGRQYPTVAWWQAVGWAFNVTSTEVEVVKQATEDGSTEYMAVVAIVRIDTGRGVDLRSRCGRWRSHERLVVPIDTDAQSSRTC